MRFKVVLTISHPPAEMETTMSQTRLPRPANRTTLGFLDRIEEGLVAGWALDPLNPQAALVMRVLIDGQVADVITCDRNRADVAALHLPSTKVGFEYRIPARFQDGLRHVLAFSTIEGEPIHLPGRGGISLKELHFSLTRKTRIDGVLDGLVDGLIQGWVIRADERGDDKSGGVRVLVSCKGQPIAELLADQFRADVAEALGADPACGFSFALPAELRHGKSVTLDFHVMPERIALRGSPLEIAVPTDAERARIEALIGRTDELFRTAYHLRRELKAALPSDRHSVAAYGDWSRRNAPLIGPRAKARYGEIAGTPLVSILCPVYRPEHGAFLEAIDSVMAQTYRNWELILVDDGGRDEAVAASMRRLALADPRIRAFTQGRNGGISAATNKALAEARGEVIGFFDHDDRLDPHALEVMLRARAATGARLLYSDEDKINAAGKVSEPNFKPDFNYRLLLDQNYICHFVIADAGLAREAGGFDAKYDGAQDHDFLLRLTETLHAHEIHHVPEILYHWRISQTSTAGSASAKPKAAMAGEAAVGAHLKRRQIPAKVARRGDLTCYRTRFEFKDDPGVSILIPFRDHIEMTRQCVQAIRAHTQGARYEIILLDNWSQSLEAERFCIEQANLAETRVLRIAEPFNYSRINNLGAKAARHPYLLLLNNDVFVSDPGWLRILLNEALAAPDIGAVGAKLLYPNGTVQHAGVVLGVGGIAEHAFRGIAGDAPGYLARAISAAEVGAVTAACLLARREAFERIGGFDEAELSVAFNDVDLCIRLRQAGYRILFTPDCVAEHRESLSRGDDFDEDKLSRFMLENEVMQQRWQHVLPFDPFYNRNFSRDGGIHRDLRLLDPEDEIPVARMKPVPHPVAPVRQARVKPPLREEPAKRRAGARGGV
jgi:GT2 family glycosyltransferase